MMSNILILEDDLTLAQTIARLLDSCGFNTQICRRLTSAYAYLASQQPDLAIIDRVLPDGDGLEIVEYLHETSFKTKVLILSQKAETLSRVEGLTKGADDYLAKPFSAPELKLRILSLANKTKQHSRKSFAAGQVEIFPQENLIKIGQKIKKLRGKETQLLHCLLVHPNQVVTRQQLENWLWGCQEDIPTRSALDVYVKRVRRHLGEKQACLKTIRGCGYQFIPEAN